ncbi:MAG: DNA polymerase III subunit gamma/tau [Pseudomonadota bacterium]|nr:DNA polymerase III subunit gamma/tau [Pseudomonadota bacterium]
MSYQVLARKYRPKNFSEVVGQDHVVKALSNSLDGDQIHQAYLLSGTRGVGKTTIGRILTKSLNCEEGLTSKPCNNCNTCTSINEGSFMDFQEVDAASRRGVEETQQLLETVLHMPGSSRYKVYLIDEVHMLSKHSFNALLKTLEEPPPHVVFILATTEPESVPATVLSRCLQFHLKNITSSELIGRLEFILKEENISFDKGSLSQLAKAARGSLRDCLTVTDQAIAFTDGKLKEEEISEMLGTLPQDQIFQILEAIIENDPTSLLTTLKEISSMSVDYQRLMDLLLEAIQNIALIKLSPSVAEELDIDKKRIEKLSSLISQTDIQIMYQIGLIAKRDLDLAPNMDDGFEMAMLRMLSFLPDADQEGKKKVKTESRKINKPEEKDTLDLQEDKRSVIEEEAPQNKVKDISSKEINPENWNLIFESLELDPATRQLLSYSSFKKVDESVIYFSMPEEKLLLLNGKHRQRFNEALEGSLGKEVTVFFEEGNISDDSPKVNRDKEKLRELNEAANSLNEDPNVKHILDSLGGKIIESSIKRKEAE